ncbi:unnamed protein product [Ranitomeya imitator]|uniref:EF-hand domain-containing protein n=1 Tax=Ranitomeya imitator TaxID=111125 RepID=A0ABN9KSZ9_9NEOB|nr:unnamed protein product [Ranitomeya imitator]
MEKTADLTDVQKAVIDTLHKADFIPRKHLHLSLGLLPTEYVLTIFSASNYYEIGSNKGAYVRLGPDLVPHFVQYQASKSTNTLTLRQRVSTVEASALRALREKLFAHKSDLIQEFNRYDKNKSGYITLNHWATALESILNLRLPWRMLRPQLVRNATDGLLRYKEWFDELAVCQSVMSSNRAEKVYWCPRQIKPMARAQPTPKQRNGSETKVGKVLTVSTILDLPTHFTEDFVSLQAANPPLQSLKDQEIKSVIYQMTGLISFEEFKHTWKLLRSHLKIDVSDEAICNMAKSMDFNKDGDHIIFEVTLREKTKLLMAQPIT